MSTTTTLMCCVFMVLVLSPIRSGFTVSQASGSIANYIPVRSDLNGDGVVNIVDLAEIANQIGSATWDPRFDLNNDGRVNILDMVVETKDLGLNLSAHVASGVWNIVDRSLDGSSSNDGLIYTEDARWEDCTLAAKVKILGDSAKAEVTLAVCVGDSGNFYWAGLGCWGHGVSISRMMNYVPEELAFSGDRADVVKDAWYSLSVKILGNAIMLYVNDSLKLVANDSSFDRGAVGIRIWNSHVIIDRVTIIGTRASRSQPSHEVLYADGTKLRSPSGDEVILVGTQFDYNVLNRDIWFNVDDVRKMKSYGGVVLELHALLFKDMMPHRGVIDQNWINRLDKWVSWCEQEQMYYVITFGNFEYKPWGREAPYWFFIGKYDYPWDETTWSSSALWNQASIDFWDIDNPLQEDNRQAVLDGFQFIANRYKNNKYVLFGLFNEPFCSNDLVNSRNAEHLSITYARFIERIVDTIRSTGAKQLIFVDKPYCWFYTSHFEPVNRDGIVWEDHLYASFDFDISQWKSLLNEYVQRYVYTFNKPFYVGEYAPYPMEEYHGLLSNWRTILAEQVAFLKSIPVCGYSWHEYPWLDGEYYDYVLNILNADDSEYTLKTVFG